MHRDIKVDNLLFTDASDLRLCDFGFARVIADNSQMTRLGTPEYIAPEIYDQQIAIQMRKNVAEYDDRADVWSIGVVAYSLAIGKTPFEGSIRDIV